MPVDWPEWDEEPKGVVLGLPATSTLRQPDLGMVCGLTRFLMEDSVYGFMPAEGYATQTGRWWDEEVPKLVVGRERRTAERLESYYRHAIGDVFVLSPHITRHRAEHLSFEIVLWGPDGRGRPREVHAWWFEGRADELPEHMCEVQLRYAELANGLPRDDALRRRYAWRTWFLCEERWAVIHMLRAFGVTAFAESGAFYSDPLRLFEPFVHAHTTSSHLPLLYRPLDDFLDAILENPCYPDAVEICIDGLEMLVRLDTGWRELANWARLALLCRQAGDFRRASQAATQAQRLANRQHVVTRNVIEDLRKRDTPDARDLADDLEVELGR